MKFKSEEPNVEIVEQDEKICNNDNCAMCQTLKIMSAQLDLIYNVTNALRSTLETIYKLHEEHDSK